MGKCRRKVYERPFSMKLSKPLKDKLEYAALLRGRRDVDILRDLIDTLPAPPARR